MIVLIIITLFVLFVTIVEFIIVTHTGHPFHYSALNSTGMKYRSHDKEGGALLGKSQ